MADTGVTLRLCLPQGMLLEAAVSHTPAGSCTSQLNLRPRHHAGCRMPHPCVDARLCVCCLAGACAVQQASQPDSRTAFTPDELWPARALLMDVYYAQTLCWQVRGLGCRHMGAAASQALLSICRVCALAVPAKFGIASGMSHTHCTLLLTL